MNHHYTPNPRRRERILNLAKMNESSPDDETGEPVTLPELLVEGETIPMPAKESGNQ